MAQDRNAVTVRLTHKFAQLLNGIDVSRVREGEEMKLSRREAFLLVAEGWAEPLDTVKRVNGNGKGLATAADKQPKRRTHRSRPSKSTGR